jgi:hypothetical protein
VRSKSTDQDANEENNTAELVVNVLPEALPDLYIADFSINPEEPRVGEPAAIRVVVRNRGNAASGVFGFALYLVQPGPVESIQLQHDCRSLAPGEERVPVSLFAFSQSGPATLRAEVLSVPSGMTICFEELVVNVRPAS